MVHSKAWSNSAYVCNLNGYHAIVVFILLSNFKNSISICSSDHKKCCLISNGITGAFSSAALASMMYGDKSL